MSRYTKILPDGKEIAYGHDHTCGYFFQVFAEEQDGIVETLLVDECSTFSKMSKNKMLELLQEYQLPVKHQELVAFDLPF